jgi:hypothetical protein
MKPPITEYAYLKPSHESNIEHSLADHIIWVNSFKQDVGAASIKDSLMYVHLKIETKPYLGGGNI